MNRFEYYIPTKIVFGRDAELQCGQLVQQYGGSRVFIVYGGGSVVRSGLLSRIETELDKSGIVHMASGGVQPNPRLKKAEEMIRQAIDFQADFILAVGGGSVIDTGKAVAHGTANPGVPLWDLWVKKAPLTRSLPIGCVLTIAASGSEMSDSAVLTNEQTREKKSCPTPFNRCVFSVLNPELMYTLPDFQISCGIVDIMMHTLDRYFCCITGNELTDQIAESVLRTVISAGRKALRNKRDYDAMSEMMWAGSVSHNGLTGLGGVRDFSVHGLGHPLSAWFDTAHGATLSVMWGWFAQYVWKENPARFARYARNVWNVSSQDDNAAALEGIQRTVEYFREISMPVCFTEAGIPVQTEQTLMELSCSLVNEKNPTVGTFKPMHLEDLLAIYRAANH